MKKTSLSLVLFVLCSLCVQAQNMMLLHQKDGGVVSYGFSEKPVVTYVGDNLHVETTRVSIDYPLASLEKMTFADVESNIDVLRTETTTDVRIYSVNGTLVRVAKAEDGAASLNTADLPAGTYIVKNGTTSYKIIKR